MIDEPVNFERREVDETVLDEVVRRGPMNRIELAEPPGETFREAHARDVVAITIVL
ncbi:hypothetical protein [Bradyrhizobium sp. 177]|uniref:hypothetical protein n=1 Tax=Bradyrhizobium sp. 177 TaxID=2782647 RepID=UPI0032119C66